MQIQIKRVYDLEKSDSGYRVLVDRVWPRGVRKADLDLDEWCKALAPSSDLRKWFGHDPARWDEFKRRYLDELSGKREEITRLANLAETGSLLLLYAARDQEHNQAVVLRDLVAGRLALPGEE